MNNLQKLNQPALNPFFIYLFFVLTAVEQLYLVNYPIFGPLVGVSSNNTAF